MDKRKLLTKKPIITITQNQRSETFDVELGKNTTSEQAFMGLVFAVETIADAMGTTDDSAWRQLELYRKARIKK